LRFRDQPSYLEAFYELQAFGLFSIASGVKTQCGQDLRSAILTSLNERFASISGSNWEMIRHRVTEYEEFSNRAPAGGLAAQRVFDRPPEVIQLKSMEAFGISVAMNASYLDALKAVERLFKRYRFDV
jgi:hypothetical protein